MQTNFLTSKIVHPANLDSNQIKCWESLSSTQTHLFSPFLSVHYICAVAASGVDVRVCVLYQNDVIQGFFPYQFKNWWSALVRAAEPVGGEMTDYFGLVAHKDFHISSNQLLLLAELNHMLFSHLDESQLCYGLSGEQPRTGLRIWLNASETEPTYPSSMSHKYLKDTERRERQLLRDIGPIAFEFNAQEDRRDKLQYLIAQKRSQYQRTSTEDALVMTWKQDALLYLLSSKFATCSAVLSHLMAGDQWVASHFGIMGNGVLQYWFPVYNPELSKYAPGRLLLHHICKEAPMHHVRVIDRGEGDTPSKREITNDDHQFYRGSWHNKSASSYLTRGVQSVRWRFGI